MPHLSFCAHLITSHKFHPYSFFTLVCHAVLNFALPRCFRRVAMTVMWVPAWPTVLNCANNSPIENPFLQSRARHSRTPSPDLHVPGGGGVLPPSRRKVEESSRHRRPLSPRRPVATPPPLQRRRGAG
jgi:hypothetical protein